MFGGFGPINSDVSLAGVAKAFGVRLVSLELKYCIVDTYCS